MRKSVTTEIPDQETKKDRIPVKDANIILLITMSLWLINKFVLYRIPLMTTNIVVKNIVGKILIVAPGLIYLATHHKSTVKVLGIEKPNCFNLLMTFCAALCCWPISGFLNMLSMFFVKNRAEEILSRQISLGFVPTLILTAVLPALTEEFVFRGIMYRSYRKYSVIGGALISALVFGLMHLNLNQMIYTVFNGIIFALMLEATGSIVTPVSMHFLINSFPILFDFLMRDGSVSSASGMTSDTISPIILIVFGAISALSLYFLYRVIRKTAMRNKRFIAPAKTVSFKEIFDPALVTVLITAAVVTLLNTNYL